MVFPRKNNFFSFSYFAETLSSICGLGLSSLLSRSGIKLTTLIAGILCRFLAYLLELFSCSTYNCISFNCLVRFLTSSCSASTSLFLSSMVFSFNRIWYFSSSLSSFLSQRCYMTLLSWSKNLAPSSECIAYWSSSSLYSS